MPNDYGKPQGLRQEMRVGVGMHQTLVMTPELSADTNEEAAKKRESIRNRFKLILDSDEEKNESGKE